MVSVLWAILYWALGAVLAAVPIVIDATSNLNSLSWDLLTKIHNGNYKDLAIYTMVICGVGLSDAFESGRLNRNPDSLYAFIAWFVFAVLLVFLVIIAYSFGALTGVPAGSTPKDSLPLAAFVTTILVSLSAKLAVVALPKGTQDVGDSDE